MIRSRAAAPVIALLMLAGGPANSMAASGPDFTVAASPASAVVTAGGTASSKIATTASGGLSGNVAFTASGLPTGSTASFTPQVAAFGASSSLTVATSVTTPSGTFQITVTGTQVLNILSVAPIVRSATFSLQVMGAGPDPRVTVVFNTAYARTFRGLWKGPVPPACPRPGSACSIDYGNLRLPRFEQKIVIRMPKPSLSYEVLHFEIAPGAVPCDAHGTVKLISLDGVADGPFPGTAEIVEGALGPTGTLFLPTFGGGFFYRIDSPFLTNTETGSSGLLTGLISGTLIGGCSGAFGTLHYDACYVANGYSTCESGSATTLVTGTTAGISTIDVALLAATRLPGSASLAPPAPVCPPGGCT